MNSQALQVSEFKNKVAVITGGTGVLGGEMAVSLAAQGMKVAILSRRGEIKGELKTRLDELHVDYLTISADVLDKNQLQNAKDQIEKSFGRIDFLVNAAGGNRPDATATKDMSFFDIPLEALRWVNDVNLLGTILSCQVFGKSFAQQQEGAIVNISSMSSMRPLTRVVTYSAAKAAINNFTQWLAVYAAKELSPRIRVNAIAPGFFLTEQNRFLLTDKDSGELTPRGRDVLAHTPMARFGDPKDLCGALLWLLSSSASFVTGTIIPVDGGFSAFSGV